LLNSIKALCKQGRPGAQPFTQSGGTAEVCLETARGGRVRTEKRSALKQFAIKGFPAPIRSGPCIGGDLQVVFHGVHTMERTKYCHAEVPNGRRERKQSWNPDRVQSFLSLLCRLATSLTRQWLYRTIVATVTYFPLARLPCIIAVDWGSA
jgi:hypothetical protein